MIEARNMWRPATRRGPRGRGTLLQIPPRPSADARLGRFTELLDTIAEGERSLDAARRAVEAGEPARAERELSRFLTAARPALERPALERPADLPAEYVAMLGQTVARALTARAAAWIEYSFSDQPAAALREAARADVAAARALPADWLDAKTQVMLNRLERVLEFAPTS